MYNSKIEWTDHSWNPWIGCTKVSPGCQHCYAESFALRFNAAQWGPQGERKRTSPANWRKPLTWNRQNWMQCLDCGWRGQANTRNARFACDACRSHNVEPTRQRVFCASLADVFEDRPELIPWRAELFDLIANTPNLDWLLLTKRPENIRPMLFTREHILNIDHVLKPLQNLWFGTSVENQEQANKRILPLLGAWGSTTKFLSCEPLLGPIDLTAIPTFAGTPRESTYSALTGEEPIDPSTGLPRGAGPSIKWVICGGESGPHARPMHPDWARSLRDQCAEAGVPFFFKQWGEHLPRGQWNVHGIESLMYAAGCEAFGGTAPPRSIQWDEQMWAYKVGKHDAGRYLDERIHNAHPPIAPR